MNIICLTMARVFMGRRPAVPLIIRPPSNLGRPSVCGETVSLRDLPATIVDLVGLRAGSPFPGESVARDRQSMRKCGVDAALQADPVVTELKFPNPIQPNQGRSPAARGPLISLAENNFVYIRNERDGSEQLFDEENDPQEIHDRSKDSSIRPVLDSFRRRHESFRATYARSGQSHLQSLFRSLSDGK